MVPSQCVEHSQKVESCLSQPLPFSCLVYTITSYAQKSTRYENTQSLNKLKTWVNNGRDMLKRTRYTSSNECLDSVLHYVYNYSQITFYDNDQSLEALFPDRVLDKKKGACMGVSILIALLTEDLPLSLAGIVLPGHFLFRLSTDSQTRNIEPNRYGIHHPNSYYQKRYEVSDTTGYYLSDLTLIESAGVYAYNVANILRTKGEMQKALVLYQWATRLFPRYAEAWGNAAITYAQMGNEKKARFAFDSAYQYNSKLPLINTNIGLFELEYKEIDRAHRFFKQAISHNEKGYDKWYGLAQVYALQNKPDSCVRAARVGCSMGDTRSCLLMERMVGVSQK